jgi:glycosyltransferase involved in cell wall biosynthesis
MRATKIISLFTPGPFGGAERVIVAGLTALNVKDPHHELWLIQETRAPHLVDELRKYLPANLKIKIFQANSVVDIKLINHLKMAIRDVALVHAHGFKAATYAFLAKTHQKLIVTHHGTTAHTMKVRLYERLERVVMKRSDAVVAVSHVMKRQLVEHQIDKNLIHVIENPLSLNPLALNAQTEITQFIFVGRLSPEKGAAELILALKDLSERDWKLTIVGDGIERERVNALITPEIGSKIHMVGFQKDVASYLSQSHALVMPSHREGLPMALIEAICMGLPVIGSRVGALPDLVTTNGILVTPQNSTELTQALRLFMSKRENYLTQAMEQKNGFIKRFSVSSWVEQTVALYQRVLSQL